MKKQQGYYTISVVAKHFGITQQTIRLYEDKGLIKPARSSGKKRLFDDANLERLRLIMRLSRDLGVNLAGVEVILNMREKMMIMEKRYREVVELLLTEFQNVMENVQDSNEEGLIPSQQLQLMRIKERLANLGKEDDHSEVDRTIKIS
jgi:MerR family transcriptional regulator/heat shock protein HspR